MRATNHLAIVCIPLMLCGCANNTLYALQTAPGSEFRPFADAAAVAEDSSVTLNNLHMAFAYHNVGGGYGPGKAQFNGPLLDTFTMDGSLLVDAASLMNSPGFFSRRTQAYQAQLDGGYNSMTINGAGYVGLDTYITWGGWFYAHAALETRANQMELGGVYDYFGDSFHYVIGTPTPNIPQQGVAHYTALSKFVTGDLAVTWGGATPKVGLDLDIQLSPDTESGRWYSLRTTGGITDVTSSEVSVRSGSATFHGTGIPAFEVFDIGLGSPSYVAQGFTYNVEGFFAGPEGQSAGLTFWASEWNDNVSSAGSAAFRLTTLDSGGSGSGGSGGGSGGGGGSATAPLSNPTGPLHMVWGGPNGGSPSFSNSVGDVTQNATTALVTRYERTSDGFVISTAQGMEPGGDALITWGRWANGTGGAERSYDPSIIDPTDTMTADQGFHYVIGQPSASLPASGSATFNLLGATKPTFANGASLAGTVTSASLAVTWGGLNASSVSLDMALSMPGDGAYRILTDVSSPMITNAGRFTELATPVTVTSGTGRACNGGGTCVANVNGFFAGPDGIRAGLGYRINSTGGPIDNNDIYGSAAFTKAP